MGNLENLTAVQLLRRLAGVISDIEEFRFVRYSPGLGIEKRLQHLAEDGEWFKKSVLSEEWRRLGERFPGIAALLPLSHGPPARVLQEMLKHDDNREHLREFAMAVHPAADHFLHDEIERSLRQEVVGISSRCLMSNGAERHLPLLDLQLAVSQENLQIAFAVAGALGLHSGAILESGRSYHIYGFCTLDEAEWRRFMSRALLLAPIIDVRFVAHRLMAGHAVLRISTCESKPFEPQVVLAF